MTGLFRLTRIGQSHSRLIDITFIQNTFYSHESDIYIFFSSKFDPVEIPSGSHYLLIPQPKNKPSRTSSTLQG